MKQKRKEFWKFAKASVYPAANLSAVIVSNPCAPGSSLRKLATSESSPLEFVAPKHSGNLTRGAADSRISQEYLLTLPIMFVKILPAVLEADKKKQRFAKANH